MSSRFCQLEQLRLVCNLLNSETDKKDKILKRILKRDSVSGDVLLKW